MKKDATKKYGKSDLRGLKVEHSAERFKAGQEIILTLKDAGKFIPCPSSADPTQFVLWVFLNGICPITFYLKAYC